LRHQDPEKKASGGNFDSLRPNVRRGWKKSRGNQGPGRFSCLPQDENQDDRKEGKKKRLRRGGGPSLCQKVKGKDEGGTGERLCPIGTQESITRFGGKEGDK